MPCAKCGESMILTEVHTAAKQGPTAVLWNCAACENQVVEKTMEMDWTGKTIECPDCKALFVFTEDLVPDEPFLCTDCEEIQKRMESFGRDEEI